MGTARLHLLDGFSFEHAGSPVALPTGLQRLVAFLGLRGTTHRAVIAGTLWPEVPEEHSLGSLRTGIWRMNRLVPGLLRADGGAVTMVDTATVDSREQEAFATALLRNGSVDHDQVADGLASLWTGGLLPGWYDDWVVFERERLHQLRLHALERTAALLVERGSLDLALQAALEAVRAEPLRESSTAVLMSVYLAEGNVVDALHQYDAFRALLERELGLAPSARLEGLLPRARAVTPA